MSLPPLYHFAPAHLMDSIKKTGIRYGMIPWKLKGKKVQFLRGFQFCTVNPDWDQRWMLSQANGSKLPYDRNAYRITVVLPDHLKEQCVLWTEFITASGMNQQLADTLNGLGPANADLDRKPDFGNWVLYAGIILPKFFVAVDKNPEPTRDMPPVRLLTPEDIAEDEKTPKPNTGRNGS